MINFVNLTMDSIKPMINFVNLTTDSINPMMDFLNPTNGFYKTNDEFCKANNGIENPRILCFKIPITSIRIPTYFVNHNNGFQKKILSYVCHMKCANIWTCLISSLIIPHQETGVIHFLKMMLQNKVNIKRHRNRLKIHVKYCTILLILPDCLYG